MKSWDTKWLVLLFALTGFAIAEPVFELFRQTPEFLIARQNTVADVWALTAMLSFLLPVIAVLPAWILSERYPRFAKGYLWGVAAILCTCLFAQFIQPFEGISTALFLVLSLGAAVPVSYLLLFTRWRLLASVLAVIALVFPLRFLFFSTVIDDVRGLPESSFSLSGLEQAPDIVFIVFDELPVSTLLDNNLQVDGRLFPGFKRLQNMSNWYFNTSSISDSTMVAVPAILTGIYPDERAVQPTIAEQPLNLFTLLRNRYSYNVTESVARLCPADQCSLSGPGNLSRFRALLLDLLAIYLHRVTPGAWQGSLPDVALNWSGFFADRQVFFPQGWLDHMGQLIEVDRPGLFRAFISSIKATNDKPGLNFIHVLIPHEPLSYLPSGENYGLVWMRGRIDERWEHHDWAIVSARQRHYLQVQLADRLLDELLDQLENEGMLDSSLVVVVSDHGASMLPGDQKRVLSDENAASMLRVPVFIKSPGQVSGQRVTSPVMTVDILPTILSQLGVDTSGLNLDGIDLGALPLAANRDRFANSYASGQLKMKLISEDKLDVRGITADNREQLGLDGENSSLWDIGPFGDFRGHDLSVICTPEKSSLKYHLSETRPLPHAELDRTIPAYVAGTVSGPEIPQESSPFVISSNGLIAASGLTWNLRGKWLFFALVEPAWVKQANWAPEIALVVDGLCLRGLDD